MKTSTLKLFITPNFLKNLKWFITGKKPEKRGNHYCTDGISICEEMEDGGYFFITGEGVGYDVNYCPFCGDKAQKEIDEKIIKEIPSKGESNEWGHTCSQCGKFSTHEDIGTYKMLNPECPYCGWNTEIDHH